MYYEFTFTSNRKNEFTGKYRKYWLAIITSNKKSGSDEFWNEVTDSYHKYNEAHGVSKEKADEPSKFSMHLNDKDEHICSLVCAGFNETYVDIGLRYIEGYLGGIPSLTDMKNILKQIEQYERINN